MGRLVVVAMLVVGCARVGDGTHPPDAAPAGPKPFGFHLIIHVFAGSGAVISADDETSEHAFIEHEFAFVDELPEVVVLPLFVNGVQLSLSTDGCAQPGPSMAYEHIVVSSLTSLDSSDLVGTVARDCTYLDGTTKTLAPATTAFIGVQNGTHL